MGVLYSNDDIDIYRWVCYIVMVIFVYINGCVYIMMMILVDIDGCVI